jgi:hypothetical protein
MTVQLESHALEGKTVRGRYKVLALITLYLVLAVVFGAVRNELHAAPAPAAQQASTAHAADRSAASNSSTSRIDPHRSFTPN